MSQQTIFQNMTKGVWKAEEDDDGNHRIYLVEKGFTFGRRFIAQEIAQGYDHGKSDAKAIVTAVNFWQDIMSKGINPEGMTVMAKALTQVASMLSAKYNDYPDLMDVVQDAINAAKL